MISPDTVNDRITELKTEFEKGRNRLMELEQQREETRHTMSRIDGAIKVLEDLLQKDVIHKDVIPQKSAPQEPAHSANQPITAKKMATAG